MPRIVPVACAFALVLTASLPARAEQPAAPSAELPAAAVAGVTTVTATVEAINLDTREVTLKGEGGNLVKLTVGEEARNLPQLKVGDVVTFEYYQVLAVALEPTTSVIREKVEREEVVRAPLGAKPAGYVEKTVDVVGTVSAIDAKSRTVTLRGPERSLILNVAKDVDLSKIKLGQTVLARYIEGFAVSAAAPAKK
jgi:Cu/Ag efflux protein CusF